MKIKNWVDRATGIIVPFNQYNLEDLIISGNEDIPASFAKASFKETCHARDIKYRRDRISRLIVENYLNLVYERIVEHSDRYIFLDGKILCVGMVPKVKRNLVKAYKSKRAHIATKGKRAALLLLGFEHKYYIRTSLRNRTDLYNRIKGGQIYHEII